ncbi:MAG: hypothetical protein H7338_09410, partial [Candidatus Sericytochromatia bacterium]|nr:hypothetical protein [Candidatus Sericytochromatia bacterium]
SAGEGGDAVITPLHGYFRDEVRQLGRLLGVVGEPLDWPPFPMAGLAARCEGTVSAQRLETLRQADAWVMAELDRRGLLAGLAHFAVRLQPGGPAGDTLLVQAIRSDDGFTGHALTLPPDLWDTLAGRLHDALPSIRRVLYETVPTYPIPADEP